MDLAMFLIIHLLFVSEVIGMAGARLQTLLVEMV